MTEIKKPYELKEGEFCYIQDKVCQVHKIRTACGEYYMAGTPVSGDKKELDHIVDCTETVKVPVATSLKLSKISDGTVTVADENGEEHSISIEDGPVADNIKALVEEGHPVNVKVISVEGKLVIVDVDEQK